MKKKLSTLWFKYLTSSYLIYNTCWEDPKIDRFLLEIDNSSNLLMITSAGENAFDYLLDNPKSIDCVDINPYQNYLIDLKYSLFKSSNHKYLTDLFLTGKSHRYQEIYESIKPDLRDDSKAFWDSRIAWFSPQNGFYKHGLTGRFAKFLNTIIDLKKVRAIQHIISESSEEKRTLLFNEHIEPILWKVLSQRFWKSDWILGFAGIPSTQSGSMTNLNEYMKNTIRNIFVEQGVKTNYFWRLYLEGSYSNECKPSYLKKEKFDVIAARTTKLNYTNQSVTSFLNSSQKKYSHFILLDHQDWLIGNGTDELEKEWIAILKRAKPKAKILFRSVHKDLDFLPKFVKDRVSALPIDQNYLLKNDRVATYPSTFLLEVNV